MTPPLEHGAARAHLLLVAWIGLVAGWAALRAEPVADVRARVASGSPAASPRDVFVLSQRGGPEDLARPEDVARLFADPDPALREIAFTNAVTRRAGESAQRARLAAIPDPAERLRSRLWLLRRPTRRGGITRAELAALRDSLSEAPR